MFRSYPDKKEFLDLFAELAAKIRDGSRLFLIYLEDYNNSESLSSKFKDLEHSADLTAHKINEKLYKSYLAPFEPADIQLLAEKMDSVLDLIVSAQIKLGIYKLKPPFSDMAQLAAVLDETVQKIDSMIKDLADPKAFGTVLEECAAIREMEAKSGNLFYELIKRLFAGQHDPVALFSRQQILEQIKEAMDRCVDVADTLEGIILKNG